MSDGTVQIQVASSSQAILYPVLADILSFRVAIFPLSEKNTDFRNGILYIVEE